jgi:hypothetical protein
MPKRRQWPGGQEVFFEGVRESEFSETLAELGTLIYHEFCSRQLHQKSDTSSAASSSEKIVSPKWVRKERCE